MTTYFVSGPSQHVASQDRADALRILSEYVRSFDTDPEPEYNQHHWMFAPAPYNQTPIYLVEN